jgi:acylphosphatase
MKRIHLIISGDVQGVGYRAWVRREALKLNLSGWIKNREDGAVELRAEGVEVALQKLIDLCKKGPEVGWVKEVSVKWNDYTGEYKTFEIVRE